MKIVNGIEKLKNDENLFMLMALCENFNDLDYHDFSIVHFIGNFRRNNRYSKLIENYHFMPPWEQYLTRRFIKSCFTEDECHMVIDALDKDGRYQYALGNFFWLEWKLIDPVFPLSDSQYDGHPSPVFHPHHRSMFKKRGFKLNIPNLHEILIYFDDSRTSWVNFHNDCRVLEKDLEDDESDGLSS